MDEYFFVKLFTRYSTFNTPLNIVKRFANMQKNLQKFANCCIKKTFFCFFTNKELIRMK